MKPVFQKIFSRYPKVDGIRLWVITQLCNYGIRMMDSSYEITRVIAPDAQPYINGEKPALFALYHGRMIALLRLIQPRNKLTILVSRSRDGEIIARVLGGLGFSLARGSPAHKAITGTMQMIKSAKAGQHLAVLVDGPRGPVHQVKPGVIKLAQLCQLPIIPVACSGRSNWWFWGWDKFMGTLWSSPMLYLIGNPIYVMPDDDDQYLEQTRKTLEETMSHLSKSADKWWQTIA